MKKSRKALEAPASEVIDLEKSSIERLSKREKILAGGLKVFLAHGFDGASVDKIAAEAGVSKPTIYTHFKDKNHLFSCLVESVFLRWVTTSYTDTLYDLDPPAFMTKFAQNFLKRMDDWEYISFFRLLVGESGRFPELAHLYSQRVIKPAMAKITSYFSDQDKWQLQDPEAVARIFVGSLNAYIMSQEILSAKHYLEMPRERYIKNLVDMILYTSKANN